MFAPKPGMFIADSQGLVVNVKDYGATGNGTTDDTTAIQNAINAAGVTGGGSVYFPSGTYGITSPLTITVNGIAIIGASQGSTILQPLAIFSGAGAIVVNGGNNGQIRDISFQGVSTTYSSNPACTAIQINHAREWILQNLLIQYWNGWGIESLGDSTGASYFTNFQNVHVKQSKQGIHLLGNTGSSFNSGAFLVNCNVEAIQNGDGVFIEDAHDVTITNLEGYSVAGGNCIHIKGACAALYLSNMDIGALVGSANSPTPTVLVESGTNGNPTQIVFYGSIIEDGSTCVTVTAGTDITFNAIQFIRGGSYGLSLSGVSTDRVNIINCTFNLNGYTAGANNYDLNCTASGKVLVRGNFFVTPTGSSQGQVASSCNFTTGTSEVFSNWFLGSTVFTGFPTVTRSNPGYNPVGPLTPPAIPASNSVLISPFGTDCTIHITGGTVTVIAIGGTATGLTSGTFRVPQGQSIKLTYSAAPTWTWFGD